MLWGDIMSVSGEEFAKQLRAGADDLQHRVFRFLEAYAKQVHGSAIDNFHKEDDRPRIARKRDTRPGRLTKGRNPRPVKYRTGGPIGSIYRTYKNAPNTSGYMKGPRNLTNNLMGSIMGEASFTDGKPSATISAGKVKPVKYAAAIEYGYPARKIQPRMFIGRAIAEHADSIPEDLKDVIFVSIIGGE